MNHPFFSVLMPVYNSEKYLRRAIDSVLEQTFKDIELILVDDCSTDGSPAILDEYKKMDSRVIVTKTKSNSGVANARNEGIKLINGHYLTFVDSDDYIEKDLFDKVKDVIDKTGAQLVKYSVVEQYYNKNQKCITKRNVCLKDKVYITTAEVRQAILPMEKLPLFGYLWNGFYDLKTITKDLWNFDARMYVNEDFMMNMKLIDCVSRMACMSYIGYHYEKYLNNSLSTKQNDQYYECSKPKIEILLRKYQEWNLLTPSRKAEIYWLYIRIVYSTVCRALDTGSVDLAKDILKKIYHDKLFMLLCKESDVGAVYEKKEYIMYRILKNKWTLPVIFFCKVILFIKKNFQVIFSKVKG